MNRSAKFWISMTVFQVAFGLAVFAATRHHYLDEAAANTAGSAAARPPLPVWRDSTAGPGSGQFGSPTVDVSTVTDPAELGRIGDGFFNNKQYEQAAETYERLLTIGPNVNTYNNLGITLFYLGRSDEALNLLNEGIATDPRYQRIWLTLGFVNSRLGNIEQARSALTTAVELGADTEVGQSAKQMRDSLP